MWAQVWVSLVGLPNLHKANMLRVVVVTATNAMASAAFLFGPVVWQFVLPMAVVSTDRRRRRNARRPARAPGGAARNRDWCRVAADDRPFCQGLPVIEASVMPTRYLRFVTTKIDPDSGRRRGLFQAAGDLEAARRLSREELEELKALQRWFAEHLNAPDRFARSERPGAAPRAISWFKSSATQHISNMRAMCRILNRHGVATEMILTARPGYIVFEDEHQVAAEPFADTKT